MARMGSFIGPTEPYGTPLAVVHPPDNNVQGARFYEGLRDPALLLTEQQKIDLQAQIAELYALMRLARDLPG